MPRSDYFKGKLVALMKAYDKAFPTSKYPGTFSMATHITPKEERLKKMFLVFPHWAKHMDLPAIVCTVHQHNGSHIALRLHITNNILGTTSDVNLRVSNTDRKVNHAVMDVIVTVLRKQMWSVGPAIPDHYKE